MQKEITLLNTNLFEDFASEYPDFNLEQCVPSEQDFEKIALRYHDYKLNGKEADYISTPWGLARSTKSIYKQLRYFIVAILIGYDELITAFKKELKTRYKKEQLQDIMNEVIKTNINILSQHAGKYAVEKNESLQEASNLTPLQKMQAFNNGTRKENVKACGDEKLVNYYNICCSYNLTYAKRQLEIELARRGMQQYIRQPLNWLTPNDFTDALVSMLTKTSYTNLEQLCETRGADFAITCLVFAICLDDKNLTTFLKNWLTQKAFVNIDAIKVVLGKALKDFQITQKIASCISNLGTEPVTEDLQINGDGPLKKQNFTVQDFINVKTFCKAPFKKFIAFITNKTVSVYDELVKYLICAILAQEIPFATEIRKYLLGHYSDHISKYGLNAILSVLKRDTTLINYLVNLVGIANSTTNISTTNTATNNVILDINNKATPNAAYYRIVCYSKKYNPPARQYYVFRKCDASKVYKIGIEGSPRNSPWTAEPLFDSARQAESFITKSINTINTVKDLSNFKYNIISADQDKGNNFDLNKCKLVNTICGPAYIQLASNYCESVEDLEEDIEKHDILNPKLWNEDFTLKSEVKDKILEIVKEFENNLAEDNIKFNVKDIILVGSNVNYNYTKDSDLDIHIITDTTSLNCPDNLYPALYSAYRSLFNKNLDIEFYGIPVEIYIETEESPRVSNGCYSVSQDKWINEPKIEDIPDYDEEQLNNLVTEWETKYQELLDKDNLTADDISSFIEQIYELRKEGLTSGSEWDVKNLTFKEFRNRGYLDHLKELKNGVRGKELSLESFNEDTKKVKDHKWVNKGKEGTHGEFKTKKEADAQRKAMFANGFHEDYDTIEQYKTKLRQITHYIPMIQKNGLFELYNIPETDVYPILNKLNQLSEVEWVQKAQSSFDFNHFTMSGQPKSRYKIYGQLKFK